MKKYVLLVFCVLVFFPVLVSAQPGPPDTDVSDVPIDGGLSVLAAAGVAYGIKKYKQAHNAEGNKNK